MQLDHVVIIVDNLDLASQDYSDLGFTVAPGGVHGGGVTQNALVAFEDGSYLELLEFLQPPPDSHIFARGVEIGEGMLTFALLPDDIEADVARARRHGLQMHGPSAGGRTRPDGLAIAWKTARTGNPALPFLCADVTARDLRVPYGPARLHANGVEGISQLTVLAQQPEETAKLYAALLGEDARSSEDALQFSLGSCSIALAAPGTKAEREYMQSRGPGPYTLTMPSRSAEASMLDAGKTHGVEIRLKRGSET